MANLIRFKTIKVTPSKTLGLYKDSIKRGLIPICKILDPDK